MKKALIINGGQLTQSFLRKMYREIRPDWLIAVDGALTYVQLAGLLPTHIVGDFDTVQSEVLKTYEKGPYVIENHKPEKDETDSELAMELALSLQPDEITVLGATGYRMDHALANLQLLYRPFESGIFCSLLDECNEIFLIGAHTELKVDGRWKYVSFLPFTDSVEGITLEGFKYPLQGYTMHRGILPGLGISNEFRSERASVSLERGILLCIRSRDALRREHEK